MNKKWIAIGLCLIMVLSLCACKPDDGGEGLPSGTNSDIDSVQPTDQTVQETEPTETTTETTTQALVLSISCLESKKGILSADAAGKMVASFNKEGYAPSDVKWASSAPAVLAMEEDGTYKAAGIGKSTVTATITHEDETATKSFVYDVQKLVTGVTFNTTSIEVKTGFGSPIGATALPEDATDKSITWGNSNPNIASIQGSNVVGYNAGNCVLTAYNNRGDALGTVNVTVLPGPIYGADANFGNQIVEFSTTFNAGNANRTTNLKVAAQAIMAHNGGVLIPGESFSFNAWVGERTRAKGYRDAGIFNGSKEEIGLAGGICQVSTTLFNAALLANFAIGARSPHSMHPQYSRPGLDAAIQWPSMDLRFTNTLTVPVKIVFQFSGSTMTVRLFTPGDVSCPLPTIRIEQGGSGLNYWMKRYANGEMNYSCNTRYVAYLP